MAHAVYHRRVRVVAPDVRHLRREPLAPPLKWWVRGLPAAKHPLLVRGPEVVPTPLPPM